MKILSLFISGAYFAYGELKHGAFDPPLASYDTGAYFAYGELKPGPQLQKI